jgi:hypothetical protein
VTSKGPLGLLSRDCQGTIRGRASYYEESHAALTRRDV